MWLPHVFARNAAQLEQLGKPVLPQVRSAKQAHRIWAQYWEQTAKSLNVSPMQFPEQQVAPDVQLEPASPHGGGAGIQTPLWHTSVPEH